MGDSGSGMDAVQTCKGAKVQNVKPGLRMVAACSRACLEVGTAPRAVLGDYRVRSTDLEGGRDATRYHRHLVGAWFTASSCGGGQGEALPLPETARLARSANPTSMQRREKGAKGGSGKIAGSEAAAQPLAPVSPCPLEGRTSGARFPSLTSSLPVLPSVPARGLAR